VPYELDFKAISATPITDVARALGFVLTEKGEQLVGQCPISQTGNSTAFKITPSINRFICFCSACRQLPKQGGDCIELVRRFRRIDPKQVHLAAQEVQKLTGGASKVGDNAPQQQEVAEDRKSLDFDPLKYLASLDAEHEALSGLDILPETLVHFKAGYCSKGRHRGRLAVAWHDVSGTLRFFIGVALAGEVPRYLAPKNHEMPYWFGVDRVEEAEDLHIVSDVFVVMRAYENGVQNTICPLRPCDPDALESLKGLTLAKKLTVEF
jgi:hypothetical protein